MKKLNEILGTEFPIIQGGMANIATGEFAAACSNAGALGVIAAGGMPRAELLRDGQVVWSKEVSGNGQRLNVLEPEQPVLCDTIRIAVTATYGYDAARIFEVRAY